MKKQMLLLLLSVIALTSCGKISIKFEDESKSSTETTVTETTLAEETTTETITTKPEATEATTEKTPTIKQSDVFSDFQLFLARNDYADGIQYTGAAKYTGQKTIDYYTVYFDMYDPVGNLTYDSITGKTNFSQKVVGPTYTGDYITFLSYEKPEAYCSALKKLSVGLIYLEYSDGTSEMVECNVSANMDYDTYEDACEAQDRLQPGYIDYLKSKYGY